MKLMQIGIEKILEKEIADRLEWLTKSHKDLTDEFINLKTGVIKLETRFIRQEPIKRYSNEELFNLIAELQAKNACISVNFNNLNERIDRICNTLQFLEYRVNDLQAVFDEHLMGDVEDEEI